jgi:predicted Zn-dependent peptidase
MRKFKLKNGITVVHDQRDSDIVAIEVCVGTGSNNESKRVFGISHFLEHMLFEGTKTRDSKQISETIENIGGEMNAATSNERTFYYIKLPKDKINLGFDILSDIIINPAFRQDVFEKERKVILEEIKMVKDQPLLYQWVLFEQSIFKKHPTKNPVYGNVESVKAITRQDMVNYYGKWYVPGNMVLSVVGNINNLPKLAEKFFGSIAKKRVPATPKFIEPIDTKPTFKKESRNINQAYFILGNKTVHKTHKDSVILDVISAIFSKGLSGRVSHEIRVKRGLAYSVGTHHESKIDYGFFVFYLNCDAKNLNLCKSIILEEITKLDNLKKPELEEAKTHLVGRSLMHKEDAQKRADELASWEQISSAKDADTYLDKVKKVTVADILRVKRKYLNSNYTSVLISK